MEKFLKLVKIDVDYCNYLRKFDSRLPYNYGKKESRPFIGVLFKVNKCMYFAPLSSPKPKHLTMKKSIDFMKLDNGKLGVVNFNNMIPVKDKNITILDLNNKLHQNIYDRCCDFKLLEEKCEEYNAEYSL